MKKKNSGQKILESRWLPVAFVVFMSAVFAVIGITQATTIGTNVSTGGNLVVTGGIYATSTLLINGNVMFNGMATTTASSGDFATRGNLFATSTLVVDGKATLNGDIILGNAAADTITANGRLDISNASSSLTNFGGGTTVAGLLFGTCTVTLGSMNASTTAVSTCATTPTITGYKIFVMPNITDAGVTLTSASSTGANTIQVAVYYNGYSSSTGTYGRIINPEDNTWSWLAIK